jgi:hypothetical protein
MGDRMGATGSERDRHARAREERRRPSLRGPSRGAGECTGDEPRRGLEPSTYRDHTDRAEHDLNEVVAQVESGATSAMTAAKRCSGSPACACAYSLASSIDSNGPTIESGGPWNGPHSTT